MASERIAVIGNGIIGHGTAQVFAMAGHPVTMIGRNPKSLETALQRIKASLKDFVAHGILTQGQADAVPGRVGVSTDLGDAQPADFVLEAVTEDLELKIAIFARLDTLCRPDAILASSSGQPASALVSKVKRKERVIAALEQAGWVQARAARLLGMTPRQIAYRVQILNIEVKQI